MARRIPAAGIALALLAPWAGAAGAPPAEHWAFRRLAPRDPPGPGNPIDAFLAGPIAAKGVAVAPQASRRSLLRRASFELLGLPPARAEVEAFESDADPAALDHRIDALLADPRFGERQARLWMDVARYADSDGYEFDVVRPWAWPYRDFLIRAFDEDMPFDRFTAWQLAGDEIAPGEPWAIAATGFLAAGPRIDNQKSEQNRYDELDDMLATTSSAFLALSVGCARCHDHKFDPIPALDYYRMLAAFTSTQFVERPLRTEGGDASLPEKVLAVTDVGPEAAPTFLLARGNPAAKKEPVDLQFLHAVTDPRMPAPAPRPTQSTTGRRRAVAEWITDVQLGAGHLLARVIVNRIWQQHFGVGLVATPNDFGTSGARPSHPELLDWLASELVRGGWRLKPIHRLILSSAAWRRSSAADPASLAADPDNALLARQRLERLDAESIRDAILSVSGALNPQMYGPPVLPPVDPAAIATGSTPKWPRDAVDDATTRRRSVYVEMRRSVLYPMLELFDATDATCSVGSRNATLTAPQALALLNDEWVRGQARLLAATAADQDDAGAIDALFERALQRRPTDDERASAATFLASRAAEAGRDAARVDFAQVLFNLDEFVFVD